MHRLSPLPPEVSFCPRPDPCTFPLRIRRPELAERCLRLWSYPTSVNGLR